MVLACFGLPGKAEAGNVTPTPCSKDADCSSGQTCCSGVCVAPVPDWCDQTVNPCCCYCVGKKHHQYLVTGLSPCHPSYSTCSVGCGSILGAC
jgi:hypothetical protein